MTEQTEILVLLINDKFSEKVKSINRANDLKRATIFYAHSMLKNKVWKILGLDDIHRQCLFLIGPHSKIQKSLNDIDQAIHLNRNKNGIGLIIPINQMRGVEMAAFNKDAVAREEKKHMYEALITIVDRGKSDPVLEAANKAGAQGGTIIHGRGTADQVKKMTLFNMEIEPEKEIIAIIAAADQSEKVAQAISQTLNIEDENTGIFFSVPLLDVKGISS